MWREIIYTYGVIFLYQVQAQFCNCGGPVQKLISQESLPAQIIRPQITSVPVDSSVSNSLANALQLLIVSDVIASTINPRATIPPCMLPTVTAISEQMSPPLIYSPADFIVPTTEYISSYSSPVIELLRPQCLESVVNVGPVTNLGSNIYGLQEIVSTFSPSPSCLQELVGPIKMASLSPNLSGGLAELIGPIRNLVPVTELTSAPGMQGALTLNLGSPSQKPCGNINVETIPYTGVNYFY